MSSKLLVGSTGVLGSSFEGYDLLRPSKRELDITSRVSIADYLDVHPVDTIINCAAMVGIDLCEHRKFESYVLNVHGASNLAQACSLRGIRLVHFSSLYSGYENQYTKTKLVSEEYVREHLTDHAILRLPWMFGGTRPTTFLHKALECLHVGTVFKAYPDVGYVVYTKDVVDYVMKNIDVLAGTLDLIGTDTITKKDVVEYTADLLRLKCRVELMPRAHVMTLHLGKHQYTLRNWRESLKEYLTTHTVRSMNDK